MDGILVINKPLGYSSHDMVSQARKLLNTKKVGHSGTLDVEASGVLVLGVNKGTKLMNYLNQDDKAYHFTVFFGRTTDTLDHTGVVTDTKPIASLHGIDRVIEEFLGEYKQVPPAYSAVKVEGKKLYEYAREGKAIPVVKARTLSIYQLSRTGEITKVDDGFTADFYVHASKGLYVRKLAEDIASKLNTVAHTTAIHRVKAGDFTIDDALDYSRFKAGEIKLMSMSDALCALPSVEASEETIARIRNGQTLTLDVNYPQVKIVKDGALLAIYEKRDDHYKANNVFM